MYTSFKKKTLLITAAMTFFFSSFTYAAEKSSDDLGALMQNQQQILGLITVKNNKQVEEVGNRVNSIERQIADLRNSIGSLDTEGAINALSAQIVVLQEQLQAQTNAQAQLIHDLKDLKEQVSKSDKEELNYNGSTTTTRFLVNPGPSQEVSYTQDAINSQGNSTMVFTYAPNQLYKVYCRVGYLTDLIFKAGEKITFVGGGDTAAWMLDSAEVDGTPHLYIKPINSSSTTNLVINTNKRSYQVIAVASDWYNPMVKWSYSSEEQLANKLQKQADEKIYTGTLNITHPDQLNFDYKVKGKYDWKPTTVFDDGKKTYLKFDWMSNQMPILFIKEPNRKEVSLVNYRVKDNYYIVDKVFTEAQLKLNDKESIKITRK